jgi:site-specific DNA-adenine methylase
MIIDVPVLLPNKMKTPKKPPFKYAGSKARMLKKYIASGFLVKEPKMFVDMFAGSVQVAYWVRNKYPDLPIVINDLNSELLQLYDVMQKNTKEYQEWGRKFRQPYLAITPPAKPAISPERKAYYYELRQRYMEGGFTNRVEESAMLMFMMRINFNGFWGQSKKYPGRYATAAGNMWWKEGAFLKWEKTEFEFIEFLKTCVITQESYENTSKWAGKGVWMYADPPYRLSAENYRAAGEFDDKCQLELCEFMKDCHIQGVYSALSNREHHDDAQIGWEMSNKGRKWTNGGWFGDKFDDDWTMHMFMGHKYTSGRLDKEGCLATEILIKNY